MIEPLAIMAAIGAPFMMLLAGVALAVYACTADATAPSDYGIGGRIGARAPRFCLGLELTRFGGHLEA